MFRKQFVGHLSELKYLRMTVMLNVGLYLPGGIESPAQRSTVYRIKAP